MHTVQQKINCQSLKYLMAMRQFISIRVSCSITWFTTGVGKCFRLLGHFVESRRHTRPEKTRFPRKDNFIKIYDTINWKHVSLRWKQHHAFSAIVSAKTATSQLGWMQLKNSRSH